MSNSQMTKKVTIFRVDLAVGHAENKEDTVAREAPLHVFVNGLHVVSMLCSPTQLKELVVGHLLCEGLTSSLNEVKELGFDRKDKCFVSLRKTNVENAITHSKPFTRLIVSASEGVTHKSLSGYLGSLEMKPLSEWKIRARTVLDCVGRLNTLAGTFLRTGGVHVAVIFRNSGELVAYAEDVGRHNAVDKAIGAVFLRGQGLGNSFLALSGRLTGDLVLKAARTGVPLVASLAAAVDSGIEVAIKTGVTLVGLVRGNRMNIYAHPDRIEP